MDTTDSKIVFDENVIDKKYLYYYLQYDLAEIAKSTTKSTMIHVSMGSMKERIIRFPSLNKQKQVSEIHQRPAFVLSVIIILLP